MINTAIAAYRAANNTRKLIITALSIVALVTTFLAIKEVWLSMHDSAVIEQHNNAVNIETNKQVQKDENNVTTLNNTIDFSNTSLIDRLLPARDSASGTRQDSLEKLPNKIPHARADSTDIPGDKINSELGIKDQLHTAPISDDEITQLLSEDSQSGKVYCYPVEVENDDGSKGFIETCLPIPDLESENAKKGGGGYER